ncbi:MAG: hypothetical protein ACRDNT_30825, partial [Streptosporangiaceae bacterium]
TGTFGVAPRDAGVASATVTVGQQLGGSIGVSLLNTIFASAVASYIAAHAASARLIGRPALTGLALAHGYDTAFWWSAAIFASGAILGGALLRPGPLYRKDSQARPAAGVVAARGPQTRRRVLPILCLNEATKSGCAISRANAETSEADVTAGRQVATARERRNDVSE